ncbi:MAG: hypothetical protein ACKOXO_09775 [Cyanobium sp.]
MKPSLLGWAAGVALLVTAVPLLSPQPASANAIKCPESWTGISCDYFRDGYKAGRSDRKANMSMAYERYRDAYDSRFEENYRAGYEAGWQGISY